MSIHVARVSINFSCLLHHFVLAKLATSDISVKHIFSGPWICIHNSIKKILETRSYQFFNLSIYNLTRGIDMIKSQEFATSKFQEKKPG